MKAFGGGGHFMTLCGEIRVMSRHEIVPLHEMTDGEAIVKLAQRHQYIFLVFQSGATLKLLVPGKDTGPQRNSSRKECFRRCAFRFKLLAKSRKPKKNDGDKILREGVRWQSTVKGTKYVPRVA